ncbi:hypothetical protein Ahy_A04g019780 [Arachis hypogaea]|uniref:Protein FAR1-RELATED SEQUENCE n=1 Tax=Arachis hypogaea TaxID=3818 RepID=A0A445DGI0_ARAHY|nr:hypothetical protein Ahy_A04g019780 [Arachis hypogaea]
MHGLSFASFVGVNHYGKPTLLGCALLGSEEIPSFEWMFTQWVRCVETVLRGIITDQCKAMTDAIIRKVLPDTVHRWSEQMLNRSVIVNLTPVYWLHIAYLFIITDQCKAMTGAIIRKFIHEYDNVLKNKEQKELEDDAADSKGVIPYIGSTEFYNIAQEFVNCDEEVAILRSALWDAKSKLTDYCASMRSTTIAATQNTMPTQSTGSVVVHDIQRPSRDVVDLKTDNDYNGSVERGFEAYDTWNASECGGFMSLLNSFEHR